jgi:hypothetical protein
MLRYDQFSAFAASQFSSAICFFSFLCATSLLASADAPSVKFDVPALASVRQLLTDSEHSITSTQKTIEVIIPVSTEIQLADRGSIAEFRFDVFWNRNVYPICDYGPRTQTFSEIDGLVSVSKTSDRNASIGLNLSGGVGTANGTVSGDLGTKESTKRSYQEVPQHEVLVASGTIHRGTGAFFRFHPSRSETLEGGRDLVVAFQVPQHWRGGVLQIECHAQGARKVLGAWSEPFESSRSFVLPIYLEGDDQARQKATEFVRSEQRLRQRWSRHQRQEGSSSRDPIRQFQSVFAVSSSRQRSSELPDDWVHYLIQSSDVYLEKYRKHLPAEVERAANLFVAARDDLLKLSR